MRLPRFAPGQPIAVITIPGITDEIIGLWSLWRIAITTSEWNRHRIMPLFLADDGRIFIPTARHLWDQLLSTTPAIRAHLDTDASRNAFERLVAIAEAHGRSMYDELVQEHRTRLSREREKGAYAFAARRRAIERIGLLQVRDHRLHLLLQEERTFNDTLERKTHAWLPTPMGCSWRQACLRAYGSGASH
jgi:hypothetical protein